jgi:hypothetical protein
MSLHMTYNEILERVEKDPLPKFAGGDFPLNPGIQQVIKENMTFGEIQEHFFGRQGASRDPSMAFFQNEAWFNYQQMMMQQQQMQMQMQQEQQQAQMQQQAAAQQQVAEGDDDISKGADEALQALDKSERHLSPQAKLILARHQAIVKKTMDAWKRDSQESLAKILALTKKRR